MLAINSIKSTMKLTKGTKLLKQSSRMRQQHEASMTKLIKTMNRWELQSQLDTLEVKAQVYSELGDELRVSELHEAIKAVNERLVVLISNENDIWLAMTKVEV